MPDYIIAIHQPNFFPWQGYFDKMARADTFILLDDVQYPKTGGSWSNRVQILVNGKARWLTAPVERNYSGVRKVNEMRFVEDDWRGKLLRELQAAYAKAKYTEEAFALIMPLLMYADNNIANYNIHVVTSLAGTFGLSTPIRKSSDFVSRATATERLIELTKAAGGNTYMSGGGSKEYLQDEVFVAEGLKLEYQNFTPTLYNQGKDTFVPGLSIIDMLMHIGLAATKAAIGRRA